MAATLQVFDSDELVKQRIGYIGVSLSEWTSANEPQYTAGSSFECAGSMYYCTALEDCGTNAEWAAIGNNTLIYSYFNTSTLVFYWSSSAPAWDTAKHGWYHSVSTTHRCLITCYKDGSGKYIRKNILSDRRALYRKNYFYETDEVDYSTGASGFASVSVNTTNLNKGTEKISTKIFYLKKPVSAYLLTTRINGSTLDYDVTNKGARLSIAQNNDYRVITSSEGYADNGYPYTRYCLFLNPGKYRLNGRFKANGASTAYEGRSKHTLYISGVYGMYDVSSIGLIDT